MPQRVDRSTDPVGAAPAPARPSHGQSSRWLALFFGWLIGTAALALAQPASTAAGSIAEKPYAARPHVRGATMFAALSPEQTGVHTTNPYHDPRMFGELYQEFEGGSIGTGVAIGDYDGDGRPDLFVVSKTETCRLFHNLGDFKFEDVTDKAGVADLGDAAKVWKHGVTFVDVNNDGRLDLYVCRFNAPNLLYINQGDGTFRESAHAYGLDLNDASVMAAFCDYDRDGWLDVYIVTNLLDNAKRPNGEPGHLLHNNHDGTFTEVSSLAGIGGEGPSHSCAWWDFDNDGWPDLYVANDYGIPDRLYHNNHDGTFTNAIDRTLPHTSFYSMGSDIGDVNNDGCIDLLVADMATSTHYKDQNSIAEAREKSVEVENSPATPKYHRSALHLNTGTDRCLEAAYLSGIAATNWTWSVRFEDLDNDGWLDLHVTNGFNRDPNPDVYARMVSANSPAERQKIMYQSAVLTEANFAFRNRGDLRFEDVSAAWGLDESGVSFGAAFGDFGGDGNLDLVYSNYNAGVTLLRNDNDQGHSVTIDLRGTVSNRFGIGAVVQLETDAGVQVRQLFLGRGYMSSSEPALHFGLGNQTAIKRLTVHWPSGHVQSFEGLGVDRRFSITEPNTPTSVTPAAPPLKTLFVETSASTGLDLRSREEPVDEASIQRYLPLRLNRRGPALAVGAIDESGRECVVFGGTTLDPRRILRPNANGLFEGTNQPALRSGSEIDDGPLLLFDADGDGANDLLVTKGGHALPAGEPEYQPRLFLNDRHGTFHPAPDGSLPALSINAGAAAAADFDRDGRVDVFIGARVLAGQYPLAPHSVLLSNRGGRFEDVTDQIAPGLRDIGMVTAALWSDVDNDGWLDLLLALDWGTVKYFHNDQGHGFTDRSEPAGFVAAGTGWWTSIAGADFNGDGRIDYVVGNLGLNTPYRADPAHPAVLYSGDFKGDGSTQLLEGYYEGEKLYPWRSRKALAAIIPNLLKRYPKNEPYARATLEEIVGAEKLASAQKFTATELRSGVFLSQPDGTYRFDPLPRLAQIAPLQGIVTGDFDGDGHADIYAVQNSYAPMPAVGHFNCGLSQLLTGDGHGHFDAVPVATSGLKVPGDAKALVAMDANNDGRADFMVSRNNEVSLAFQNSAAAGSTALRVVLHQKIGAVAATGARATITYASGREETQELYTGAGYASQSSGSLFFGYTDRDRPKTLRVRWPQGTTTEHPVTANTVTITLTAP